MTQSGSRRKLAQAMGSSESTLRRAENTRGAVIPAAAITKGDVIVERPTSTASSTAERSALEACERTIEAGLQTFLEVGTALLAIRAGKLYRATHATFEAYCRQRWGLKQSRAYQLMDAADVVGSLKSAAHETSTIVELPANEAQARPLARLDPEARHEAWQEAVTTAPATGITAAPVA
jgi:hypothetical protein